MSHPEQNGAPHVNPYQEVPDLMRVALSDPAVNAGEHNIYFPQLQTLLPPRGLPFSKNRVSRILDYGCGPGNFTDDLARMYPGAHVVGVDAVEKMLPDVRSTKNSSFYEWDGAGPLHEEPFDLIVAKMVLHYLSPAELKEVVPNLAALLKPNGSLVISVPHSADSEKFVSPEIAGTTASTQIQRQIGQTGVSSTMWHRNEWVASTLHLMPEKYVVVRDEVKNPAGEPKRLNFLFCPRGERVVTAFKKLQRLGLTQESPWAAAEVTEILSDELRVAADFTARAANS